MDTRGADEEARLRAAAFDHVRRLAMLHGTLETAHLNAGFFFKGSRYPLVNPQRGIFKPRAMTHLLSIRTVFPRAGNRVWYDDQREVHAQIYGGREAVDYAFMGSNPEAADNRWLRSAWEEQVPIIYFLGIAPGRYEAILPAFIGGWDASGLKAQVTFAPQFANEMRPPETAIERRYGLRLVQQRLHQSQFRAAVIAAYDGRCALSRLPEARLLDAAHIVADRNPELGQPVVPNGLPLSKIHHAAFDAHLIGIDADYRLHVSDQLMSQQDGPVLEALKALHGRVIHLPRRERDRPDRDRLAERFAIYRSVA